MVVDTLTVLGPASVDSAQILDMTATHFATVDGSPHGFVAFRRVMSQPGPMTCSSAGRSCVIVLLLDWSVCCRRSRLSSACWAASREIAMVLNAVSVSMVAFRSARRCLSLAVSA